MKKILLLILLISIFALPSCSKKDKEKKVELVSDPSFEYGFSINTTGKGNEFGNLRVFDYNGESLGEPYWQISQHSCNKSFYNGFMEKIGKSYYYYDSDSIETSSKNVIITPSQSWISLNILGSKDYTSSRKDGQTWPHLLLEQGFLENRELDVMKSLYLNITFMLTQMDNCMGGEFNPSLHSAQFQLYFVIGSRNTNDDSSQIWFGMPFFDYRESSLKGPSGGMDTGTGMYITSMGNDSYMKEVAKVGEKVVIHHDIKPDISKALKAAQDYGFMTSSTVDDLYLVNMNLGWELPGTFDVGVDISNFSLEAYLY